MLIYAEDQIFECNAFEDKESYQLMAAMAKGEWYLVSDKHEFKLASDDEQANFNSVKFNTQFYTFSHEIDMADAERASNNLDESDEDFRKKMELVDSSGNTYFMIAARLLSRHPMLLNELLTRCKKAGVDIDAQNPLGYSAYYFVLKGGNIESSMMFFNHGANLGLKNYVGKLPHEAILDDRNLASFTEKAVKIYLSYLANQRITQSLGSSEEMPVINKKNKNKM